MCFVRRTTKRVRYEDDPESPIDRPEHRAEHTDIGFAAGDDDSVNPIASQQAVQVATDPRRIDMLVKYPGRRSEFYQVRNKLYYLAAQGAQRS